MPGVASGSAMPLGNAGSSAMEAAFAKARSVAASFGPAGAFDGGSAAPSGVLKLACHSALLEEPQERGAAPKWFLHRWR
jgi:hypothetical protein